MRSLSFFWIFLTGLNASLLASCILAKSKSKEGSVSEATNEVEVSGEITDDEPIEFVKASESVSISGVNLTEVVSYDVTAYSVDAAGVKSVIFSGSFTEPKFQFKSNVPKRYILLEIIRQPDGGKFGAILPPPTSGKKAVMVVDGTTTIAAKLAEAVTEKAASGDFNSRKALADGNISVADLLMVSQSVRRTVAEQKEQKKGSAIDLSVLANNLVIKSNDFVSRLYAEGQAPADVSKKLSEATYQTVFGEYATLAAPGILAYRTRPDLGASEASQMNVAYEAIKLSPSESMITVDQAFRVEATAYRTATSVTAAVASQSQVTSTFKTVFESCVQTPSSCAGTSYTPPPAPTSQSNGSAPAVPVISITSQPMPQSITCARADFSVTATVSQGASLIYQWQKKENGSSSFVNLDGKTDRTLSLTGLKYVVDHGDEFRVVIKSSDGVSSIISRSVALTIRLPEKPVLLGFASANNSGSSTEVQYAPLNDASYCITNVVMTINGVKSQSPITWFEEERVFGTDEAAEGDTLRFAFVSEVGEGPMSDPITLPVSCEAVDCYKIGSAPNFTQDLAIGTERQGPDNSLMTLQYASGSSGFKIWREKGGNRILNATGRIQNGWQKELTRAGTGFDYDDFTDGANIAGRVCPENVFLSHSDMTATGRCLYYDAGNPPQGTQCYNTDYACDHSGLVEGEDWIGYWDRPTSAWGAASSYYEGNIKTCADKGMRLPTMYETTMSKPNSNLPTGDIGVVPTWAGSADGVPEVNNSWTWTSSADGALSVVGGQQDWAWKGALSVRESDEYQMFSVRCVLPSYDGLSATAPTKPNNVYGIAGNTRVTLSWAVPTSTGRAAIIDYEIQVSSNDGRGWITFVDGISTNTTATITGLSNNLEYHFRVAAINSVGKGEYGFVSSSITPVIGRSMAFGGGDWANLANWRNGTTTDDATPVSTLPGAQDLVYLWGSVTSNSGSVPTVSNLYISEPLATVNISITVLGMAEFHQAGGIGLTGVVNGNAYFTNADNFGTINGHAHFNGSGGTARNMGTVNGNAEFDGEVLGAKNFGTVNGNAVFIHSGMDSTSCNSGIVTGTITGSPPSCGD